MGHAGGIVVSYPFSSAVGIRNPATNVHNHAMHLLRLGWRRHNLWPLINHRRGRLRRARPLRLRRSICLRCFGDNLQPADNSIPHLFAMRPSLFTLRLIGFVLRR
jgi:hypothetical protein